jgi:putative oxidoreductase
MDDERDGSSGDRSTSLRLVLRVGIAGLLLGPGVSKFLTYWQSVQFFERLALPAPDLLVPIVGGVELGAAALVLFDRASRLAAVLVIPVMLVAIGTAGPSWQNFGVLTAALGLLGVDTILGGWFEPKPTR